MDILAKSAPRRWKVGLSQPHGLQMPSVNSFCHEGGCSLGQFAAGSKGLAKRKGMLCRATLGSSQRAWTLRLPEGHPPECTGLPCSSECFCWVHPPIRLVSSDPGDAHLPRPGPL